ncbi:MAG: hypothetical protein RLZZ453_452 [Chlamydiota bacterium]|jgi:NDP-sugar pyrophosphorylase family protein
MESNLFSIEEYLHKELFQGCEYPWDVLKKIKSYIDQFNGQKVDVSLYPNVYFKNAEMIFVGKNVEIEPGAYIQGPCILGNDTLIRHAAYLRGGVITGKQCVIGHSSEVKDSVLLDDVCVPHFNYVGNSILGNRVNLGAGVKCANFRLDGKVVSVLWKGKKVESGLTKLGALIGDGSSLGCNCVTSPGTVISASVSCFPSLHLQGFIENKRG